MPRINQLMQKQMTRKEFLATIGFGVASLFGLGAILKILTNKDAALGKQNMGYGSGPYGGRKD
ncbi:MAG TPA: hypothetical protein VF733_03090 [Candidatus Saccharimonadales bacterium]